MSVVASAIKAIKDRCTLLVNSIMKKNTKSSLSFFVARRQVGILAVIQHIIGVLRGQQIKLIQVALIYICVISFENWNFSFWRF